MTKQLSIYIEEYILILSHDLHIINVYNQMSVFTKMIWDADDLHICLTNRYYNILKFLASHDILYDKYKLKYSIKTTVTYMDLICYYGYLCVIIYLRSIKSKYTHNAMLLACKRGHFQLIQYLFQMGIQPHRLTMDYACKYGDIRIIKFLYSIEIPISRHHVELAYIHGDIGLSNYLLAYAGDRYSDIIDDVNRLNLDY